MATIATGGDPRPWVRVIIVNYNGGSLLQPCLDALAAQTFGAFEAIIVDNASTDGSVDALRVPDPRFKLVRNPSNVGFAAANNIGARGCRAPWLATLNPDTVAEPTWLEEMHKGTQRYADVRMFGATLVEAGDPATVDGFGDVLSIAGIPWRGGCGRPIETLPERDIEVFSPCAAAALYDRPSFESVGGFDETFFCYVEDVDLGFRMRLAGARCLQLRRAVVRHHGSATTGEMSDFVLFHSYRNRIWLILKNMPTPLLIIALPLNLVCSAIIIVRLACKKLPVKASMKGLARGLMPVVVCGSRRKVQRGRKVSTMIVARSLVWDLSKLRLRAVVPLA
jgi:N-acetylglucosaminyl-diphospho-decaprenol L-rhamnosyltransferase